MSIQRHVKSMILVIDDDVPIGNMVEEILTREGYGVIRAYSGTEALLFMESAKLSGRLPELVLLDLMLPGISGEELLSSFQGIPVIVLSAKCDLDGKVELLLSGAADYITKPFAGRELLARVAVQLRRRQEDGSALRQEGFDKEEALQFKEIRLSPATHMVTVGEQPVRLTKTEFAILKILMSNPSQVVTKSRLLDRISEETQDCVESSLKVHVSNLRKKLREAGGNDGEYIEAVWGIGFKMKTSESEDG